MTKAPAKKAAESIQKLKDKDGEPNNESARTNEILAARVGGKDSDPIKESLKANDPSLSRSAYTSHESGFNEDLEPKEVDTPQPKAGRQNSTVNE